MTSGWRAVPALACLTATACGGGEPRPGTFRLELDGGVSGSAEGPASFCVDRRAGRFLLLLQRWQPAQGLAAGRMGAERPGTGEYRLAPAGREGGSALWVSPLNARVRGGWDGNLDVRGGTLRVTRSDSAELRGSFTLDVVATRAETPGFGAEPPEQRTARATGSFAALSVPECGAPPPAPE